MVHGMILQMGMIGRQVEMVMGNHDRVISRPQTDYRYHRDRADSCQPKCRSWQAETRAEPTCQWVSHKPSRMRQGKLGRKDRTATSLWVKHLGQHRIECGLPLYTRFNVDRG